MHYVLAIQGPGGWGYSEVRFDKASAALRHMTEVYMGMPREEWGDYPFNIWPR